jgi:hypothetical protein
VNTAFAPSPQFTALDRCDRCGAQAYVRVQLTSGGELLFCAHHAREHADKLQEVAAHVHDETGQLANAPATAPDDERVPSDPPPAHAGRPPTTVAARRVPVRLAT